VQVSYDEGVAIHIGPESCAVAREGFGEASAGECTGQPLNRERPIILGADTVPNVEGHTHGRAISERLDDPAVLRELQHLSSRAAAEEIERRGLGKLSYKTIARARVRLGLAD
jgi:hypothetical protein